MRRTKFVCYRSVSSCSVRTGHGVCTFKQRQSNAGKQTLSEGSSLHVRAGKTVERDADVIRCLAMRYTPPSHLTGLDPVDVLYPLLCDLSKCSLPEPPLRAMS